MSTKEVAIQRLIEDPEFDLNKHVGSMITEFIDNNMLKLVNDDVSARKHLLEHLTPRLLHEFLKQKPNIDEYEDSICNCVKNNGIVNSYGDSNCNDIIILIMNKRAENILFKISTFNIRTYHGIFTNSYETFINILKHWIVDHVQNFSNPFLDSLDDNKQNDIIDLVSPKKYAINHGNKDRLIRRTISSMSSKNKLYLYDLVNKNFQDFGAFCSCGMCFKQRFALSNHCGKRVNHKSLLEEINDSIIESKAAPYMCECGFWTNTSYGLTNHKNACKLLKDKTQ